MASIFVEKDSVFFVGGTGTKAGTALAGGCTKDFWGNPWAPLKTLADVMSGNGFPISSAAAIGVGACDVITNGAGKVRITKAAQGYFIDCSVGLVAYVDFVGVYVDGRYEVIDQDDDWIDIELAYSADTTCGANVGGAFGTLQQACDATDANTGTPHSVDILDNKDETYTGAGDRIDIDTGGGDIAAGTWKRIIGIDDDGIELESSEYVTIDGSSELCHVFRTWNQDNIEMRHIWAAPNAAYYGWDIDASAAHYGLNLIHCGSAGGKSAIRVDFYYRYIHFIGGKYSALEYVFNLDYPRYVSWFGVEIFSGAAFPLIYGGGLGHWLIDGCLFYKTANHDYGIKSHLITYTQLDMVVKNSLFYNIDDCIFMGVNSGLGKLTEFNNIYVLHTAATGLFIVRSSGSIVYSDYSCGWAIDGAPAAADRWGDTGTLGRHAIEADPRLVDAPNGDFRLQLNSPCLKTGMPPLGQV